MSPGSERFVEAYLWSEGEDAKRALANIEKRNRRDVQTELLRLLPALPDEKWPALFELFARFGGDMPLGGLLALIEDPRVNVGHRALAIVALTVVARGVDIGRVLESLEPLDRMNVALAVANVNASLRITVERRDRAEELMEPPSMKDAARVCTLKITLRGSRPPIWRRLVISAGASLSRLHEAIQIAMGWENYHLYLFEVEGREFGVPDPEWGGDVFDANRVTLARLVERGVKSFVYTYDMGDGWDHTIRIESVGNAGGVALPVCTGGRRACPPEDSGGMYGYEMKLAVVRGENPEDYDQEELREVRSWMRKDWNAEHFDRAEVNERLLALGTSWSENRPARRR